MFKLHILLCLMVTGAEVMAQVNPLVAAAGAGFRNPHPLGLTPSAGAVTIHKESENDGSGNFHYSFESTDGTRQEQTGILRGPDPINPEGVQAVQGSYSYISPEGVTVNVRYVADENGYRVVNNDQLAGAGVPGLHFNRNVAPINPALNRGVINPFVGGVDRVDPLLRHPNAAALGLGGLRPGHPAHADLLTRELLLRQQQPFNRGFGGRGPYNLNSYQNQNRFFPGSNYYNGVGGFPNRFDGNFGARLDDRFLL